MYIVFVHVHCTDSENITVMCIVLKHVYYYRDQNKMKSELCHDIECYNCPMSWSIYNMYVYDAVLLLIIYTVLFDFDNFAVKTLNHNLYISF
jgi:hypothetical protein